MKRKQDDNNNQEKNPGNPSAQRMKASSCSASAASSNNTFESRYEATSEMLAQSMKIPWDNHPLSGGEIKEGMGQAADRLE